jgi:hypothetical protein
MSLVESTSTPGITLHTETDEMISNHMRADCLGVQSVGPIQETIELRAQASGALALLDGTLVPDEVEVVAVLTLQVCPSCPLHV